MNALPPTPAPPPRLRWLTGWRLLATLVLALLLMAAALLVASPDVDGLRRVVRATARSSLLLFLLAFTATAAARRWPGPLTHWQRVHRRQLGLGFAASHGLHALALVGFSLADPLGFMAATTPGSVLSGGLAYLFIGGMAATSFDGAVRWLGPGRWQALHRAGIYFLWLSFFIAFAKRVPQSAAYLLPVALLLAAMALRWWPLRRALAEGQAG